MAGDAADKSSDIEKSGPRGPRKGLPSGSLLLAVVLLVVFFTGIVWVSRRAIKSSVGPGEHDLFVESNTVLGKIGALLEAADSVKPVGVASGIAGGVRFTRLALLADLDGDPATGFWRADGHAGLESAEILPSTAKPWQLLVRCRKNPVSAVSTVMLTRYLDLSSGRSVSYIYESSANRIRVSVALRSSTSEIKSSRTFGLKSGAFSP